jgi:uncharacterized cupredoxin-like copper-binding protein
LTAIQPIRRSGALAIALAALAPLAAIGCGGSDDGSSEGDTTAAVTQSTTPAGQSVTIKMADFSFSPKDATAPAGAVKISAPNVGKTEHELVVFKSDADPASLPVTAGEVDETAFENQGAVNVGEIEQVLPGETKSNSFNLTPGQYVMICNLPGHYAQGMYGSITVK